MAPSSISDADTITEGTKRNDASGSSESNTGEVCVGSDLCETTLGETRRPQPSIFQFMMCETLHPEDSIICKQRVARTQVAGSGASKTRKRRATGSEQQDESTPTRKFGKKTGPRRKSVQERVHEYPGEYLKLVGRSLLCLACNKPIAPKKALTEVSAKDIAQHLATAMHIERKTAKDAFTAQRLNDIQTLKACFSKQAGKVALSDETLTHRFEVARRFMMAGLPFTHMDTLRPVLENPGVPLTHSSHMRQYIPVIRDKEVEQTRMELKGQFMGIVFDGTSRIGEIVAIVARWCDEAFILRHRAVSAHTLKVHSNGQTLGRLVQRVLLTKFGIGSVAEDDSQTETCAHVVGFTRDSAAVNNSAISVLTPTFSLSVDVLCVSHTLDNIGKKIEFDNVTNFLSAWLHVAHSTAARLIWQQGTTKSMKTFSPTRWWSKSEVQNDIFENFGFLKTFVAQLKATSLCTNSVPVLERLLEEEEGAFWLHLCFAALKDISTPLILATYLLEGNQLEMLLAYERIVQLRALGNLLRETKEKVSVWLEARDATSRADGHAASPCLTVPAEQLPSVAQLIKEHANDPVVGTPVSKCFRGSGRFIGHVTAMEMVKNPATGKDELMYRVVYSDKDSEDMTLAECRAHFAEFTDANYLKVLRGLVPAFDYLEARFDGTCQPAYNCGPSLELFRLAQVFDPSKAKGFSLAMLSKYVDELEQKACFSEFERDQSTNRSPLLEKMGQEIPTFWALLQSVDVSVFDHDKPPEFTAAVLDWWRGNCTRIPNWAVAARIMFAIPPSSAAAERVFSILGNSFDPTREAALQDLVEGTLLVRFNTIQREKESRNEKRGRLEDGV